MNATGPMRRFAAMIALATFLAAPAPRASAQSSPQSADTPPTGLAEMREAAHSLLRAGDYHRAIEAYRAVVAHTVDDPTAHYDLAAAFAFLRMYIDALEPMEEALRLDPDDVHVQEMAAIVYFHLKRDEEGFAATLRMAELGDVPAMYSLVDFYERGRGVIPDDAQAYSWAERAADSGHVGAMSYLERVHREGLLAHPVDAGAADAWADRRRRAVESTD